MQTKKNNLKININKDDSGLNDFLYLWDLFKNRPNKVLISTIKKPIREKIENLESP